MNFHNNRLKTIIKRLSKKEIFMAAVTMFRLKIEPGYAGGYFVDRSVSQHSSTKAGLPPRIIGDRRSNLPDEAIAYLEDMFDQLSARISEELLVHGVLSQGRGTIEIDLGLNTKWNGEHLAFVTITWPTIRGRKIAENELSIGNNGPHGEIMCSLSPETLDENGRLFAARLQSIIEPLIKEICARIQGLPIAKPSSDEAGSLVLTEEEKHKAARRAAAAKRRVVKENFDKRPT
jgi:hypothetical protein